MLISMEVSNLIWSMTEDLLNRPLRLKWLNKSKLFKLCFLKCLERNFLRLAPVEEFKSWNHAFPEMFCFVFPLLKWSPSTLRTARYRLLCINSAFQKIQHYIETLFSEEAEWMNVGLLPVQNHICVMKKEKKKEEERIVSFLKMYFLISRPVPF